MQSTLTQSQVISRSPTRSENGLVDLATPVLEEILRVRAEMVTPSIDLRRTIDGLLKQMEEDGSRMGYNGRQLQSVKLALAAFIDETVLTADFPLREEWEKYPLQLEYVGEQLAGLTFFEGLETLLNRAANRADLDVIEVYYLCLLLGYKGKYNIYYEERLKGVIDNVADCLRRAGRLPSDALSPHWKVTDQPEPPSDPGIPQWLKVGSGLALGLAILIYVILNLLLSSNLNEAKQLLLR